MLSWRDAELPWSVVRQVIGAKRYKSTMARA